MEEYPGVNPSRLVVMFNAVEEETKKWDGAGDDETSIAGTLERHSRQTAGQVAFLSRVGLVSHPLASWAWIVWAEHLLWLLSYHNF